MAKRQLNIILGVDVGALDRQLRGVERRLSRFASSIQNVGRELTTSVTVPLGALGAASIKAFGDIEKLEKGMEAITGSSELARRELDLLRKAAEAPGLSFEQAVKGSIQLQAVKFSAEEARETISALGQAVALTGGSAVELESVVRQITQINSKGRILQEDISIIAENAPAIGIALQDAFNTTNVEAIRESGISTRDFTLRLTEAIQQSEKFQGVTGGVANAFENFRNNIKFALAELGRSINEVVNIEAVFSRINAALSNAVEFFKSLTPEARRFVVITAAIVAGIGPVLLGLGKLIALGPAVIGLFSSLTPLVSGLGSAIAFLTSPIGLTIAAVVGLVAGVAALYNRFENVRKVINGLIDFFIEFYQILKDIARPVAQIAKGLGQAFRRDFAGAAASITAAFQSEVPSITEAGVRLGTAFAGGFNDTSNRLADGIENLKARIFSTTKDIQQELTTTNLATGGGATSGGGGGSATAKEEPKTFLESGFIIDQPEVDFDPVELLNIEETNLALTEASKPLADYTAGLAKAVEQSELLGATGGDILSEKINFTKQAIQNLLAQGYTPQSEAVQKLLEQYKELIAQQNQFALVSQTVGNIAASAMSSFFTALEQGSNKAFAAFVSGFKKAIFELLKRLAIALAQAIAVAVVLSIIFPGNVAQGATFGAKLGSLFKQFSGIPGLAQGGIVPPGYPNDTFPARLSSGEAVIPLDKLNQMGGGSVFIPNLTIKGQDFVIAFEKAKASYNRYS